MSFSSVIGLAVGAALAATICTDARAQSAADFYRSKELTILVGSDAGGGYDTYVRAMAHYWQRYIPGRPSIVIKTMPGAGGIKMQNFIANQAPRDGSTIGATRSIFLVEPLIQGSQYSKYDPRKMNWIGNISPQQTACFVWHTRPIRTVQDAMKQQVLIGQTSARSNGAILTNVFNALIGTKFKVITGFSSTGVYLAMERGEVDGGCLSYATVSAAAPRLIDDHKLNFLVQIGLTRSKQLPEVPAAGEFITSETDRQVVQLLMASLVMGRPYVAPEGVPADRLDALRTSFMETMKDSEFLAQSEKQHLFVDPSDHVEMEALVAEAYRIPAAAVAKTRAILAAAEKGSGSDPGRAEEKSGE
jgi:tripartite-type tricarboxylate transporter receptor subunit TctC